MRTGNGMTIGQIIEALQRKEPTAAVRFDFVYFRPDGRVHSYRGYYEDLAIGYVSDGGKITVAELVVMLQGAIGETFTGYKGGEYDMDADTMLWVANPGDAGGTAIVDVIEDGRFIRLKTQVVD